MRPASHAAALSFSRHHLLRLRKLQQCQPRRLNSSDFEQKPGVPVDSASAKKDGSLGSDTTAPPSPSAPQPQQPRWSWTGVRTEVRDWTATDAETYQPGGDETIQITRVIRRDSTGKHFRYLHTHNSAHACHNAHIPYPFALRCWTLNIITAPACLHPS